MAPRHSISRQDAAPIGADPHELARTAGRAVALVAALRRLRRRHPVPDGGAPEWPAVSRPAAENDQRLQKG